MDQTLESGHIYRMLIGISGFESRDLQSPGTPDIARQALMSVRGKSAGGGKRFLATVTACIRVLRFLDSLLYHLA